MSESTVLSQPEASPVLVCGLGTLGQRCAVLIKELGIPVLGLHDVETRDWETAHFAEVLDRLTIGDCRHHSALHHAGVETCRAILLTTGDDRVNIGAALAARSLNPHIRLVIRSSQSNLNALLDQSLRNVTALDPSELPATAFSLAALGDETKGLFSLDGQLLRVVRNEVTPDHPWSGARRIHDLNTSRRRILSHFSKEETPEQAFNCGEPDALVEPGDVITTIEFYDNLGFGRQEERVTSDEPHGPMRWLGKLKQIRARIRHLWAESNQLQRIGVVVFGGLLTLYFLGIVLYRVLYPEIGLLDAINIATVLIFDGYSNMFAQLKLPFPIEPWLLAYSLLLTMSGTLVTGMLYAFLTGKVLSTKFRLRRHASIPHSNHIIVLGLDRLGRRVANLLKELHRPVVGVSETDMDPEAMSGIPIVFGNYRDALRTANCDRASSVVVLTEDDVANLELALMAGSMNDACNLVIRTDDAEFGQNVSALVPRAQAMSVYALAAEAFAAAALGERVVSLLRIRHHTIVVNEYTVAAGDMLEGRLLSEVEFGYGVIPILHRRETRPATEFFPSPDIRLEAHDRLVVLAHRDGLQNVEHGTPAERTWLVRVHRVLSKEAAFEAARAMARIAGCEMGVGRAVMEGLPATLRVPLYR